MQPVLWAAGGTGFTCLMTALGASMVFFFRKRVSAGAQRIFLGFAAGVMVAAAVWSLLIPAIEEAESSGLPGWLPAAGGFLLGVLFLLAMDYLMPHLHLGAQKPEGRSSSWKRTTLLIFAVTLHNIPEGMAVGFSFALAAQHGNDPALYASAMALAIGMGIQNFPEGAAISLPLRQEGLPAWKSFLYGRSPAWWSPSSAFWPCWWRGASSRCCPGCWPLPPGPCSTWWWRSSSPRPTWGSIPTWAPWA